MDRIDRWGVETLSGLHWPVVTPAMKLLSATYKELLIAIAVVAALWLRRWAPLVATLAAMALSSLLDTLLKGLVGRARPSLVDAQVHPLIAVPHTSAMPSGHALTGFACAVALGGVVPRLRPWLLVFATLVALSRPYLGVHYPSDVIVGAAVGAALGWGVAWALRFAQAHMRAHYGRAPAEHRPEPAEPC